MESNIGKIHTCVLGDLGDFIFNYAIKLDPSALCVFYLDDAYTNCWPRHADYILYRDKFSKENLLLGLHELLAKTGKLYVIVYTNYPKEEVEELISFLNESVLCHKILLIMENEARLDASKINDCG